MSRTHPRNTRNAHPTPSRPSVALSPSETGLTALGDVPRHVAIIMDGNGRWARQRNRPREFGHRAGMRAVREVVEGSIEAGVEILTLFAFSQENWQRPPTEVSALMSLLELYVRRESRDLKEKGVEVRVIGRMDRLGPRTRAALERVIEETRGGTALRLNLAISYGSRTEIVDAARRLAERVARGHAGPRGDRRAALRLVALHRRWPRPGPADPHLR